jgi:hypothetical protein
MFDADNRASDNLILLYLRHVWQIDEPQAVHNFPVKLLGEWKERQLAEFDDLQSGRNLTDDEVAEAVHKSFVSNIGISDSRLFAQSGQAPGAGGAGGFAIGPGAVGGDGGAGGDVVTAYFKAEDLPDTVEVTVGAGGRGGVDGAAGEFGGDSSFGQFITARGGKGGKAGGVDSTNADQRQEHAETDPPDPPRSKNWWNRIWNFTNLGCVAQVVGGLTLSAILALVSLASTSLVPVNRQQYRGATQENDRACHTNKGHCRAWPTYP